ncbi:hypothetical protein PSDI105340_08495 [Pseudoalteromonas distincta]
MAIARKRQVSLVDTKYYHCISKINKTPTLNFALLEVKNKINKTPTLNFALLEVKINKTPTLNFALLEVKD